MAPRSVCDPTIGVSVWPDDGRRCDDLMDHAEVAMALAKERGGGQTLFFQPGMTDSMHERLALENDLRRALAAEEFELYYQPEISAKTGKIAAAEALLRWRHPTKGLLAPSSFISLAEETGLMIPLGEWVLREACRQARGVAARTGLQFPARSQPVGHAVSPSEHAADDPFGAQRCRAGRPGAWRSNSLKARS